MFGLSLAKMGLEKSGSVFKKRKTNKPKVLLVDDYDANILIAGTYLEVFGYDYDVAQSGEDAIKKVKSSEYDAILMDIQMPEMDGIETALEIRKIEKQRNQSRQPIIALTAHPFSGSRENCLSAGMDVYLAKPFTADNLKDILSRVVKAA